MNERERWFLTKETKIMNDGWRRPTPEGVGEPDAWKGGTIMASDVIQSVDRALEV